MLMWLRVKRDPACVSNILCLPFYVTRSVAHSVERGTAAYVVFSYLREVSDRKKKRKASGLLGLNSKNKEGAQEKEEKERKTV